MLNGYQRQFLRHLEEHHVRYLVIGGVALFHYEGRPTRDLDILIDIGDQWRGAAQAALVAWNRKHPAHLWPPLEPPLILRPSAKVVFPDADCLYEDDGQTLNISPQDGVDVLTSLPGFTFDELHSRSAPVALDGIETRILGVSDLHATRANRSGH